MKVLSLLICIGFALYFINFDYMYISNLFSTSALNNKPLLKPASLFLLGFGIIGIANLIKRNFI